MPLVTTRPVVTDTALFVALLDLVPPEGTVLDVGAGKGAYHGMLTHRARHLTLVDAHEPYLADRRAGLPPSRLTTMCGVVPDVLAVMPQPSYDVALAIDFVEHLDKPAALATIQAMRRLAKTVAIFTPRGFHPQDHDYEGLGADHWQTHRSQWEAADFTALGFDVEVWTGFHEWARARYAAYPDFCPDALWAVWRA
jgi:SAM-dependent methyltransferase